MRYRFAAVVLPGLVCGFTAGCGWLPGTGEDEYVEDLPGLEFSPSDSDRAADGQTNTVANGSGQSLGLNLHVGDSFPLIKNVSQNLQQVSKLGTSTSESNLELLLSIYVDEVREDRILLRVRYHRVRFRCAIDDAIVAYDSDQPDAHVQAQVLPYRGLVENGFSFWLGQNNRILKVVDFDEFIRRCTNGVAPGQRQTVLAGVRATLGDEGIANFIDESIGLLPVNDQTHSVPIVSVGDEWRHERQISHPEPMSLQSTCRLTAMDDETAEISIVGRIAAHRSFAAADPQSRRLKLDILGGVSTGHCTVDRRTGLPIESRMQRTLQMTVHLADGTRVDQQKDVVTTIRVFPEEAATATAQSPHNVLRNTAVMPAAHATSAAGVSVPGTGISQAGFTEAPAATAVYPKVGNLGR